LCGRQVGLIPQGPQPAVRSSVYVTASVVVWQACRGRRYDVGTEVADDVVDASDAPVTNIRRIPIEADILLAYSVVPG